MLQIVGIYPSDVYNFKYMTENWNKYGGRVEQDITKKTIKVAKGTSVVITNEIPIAKSKDTTVIKCTQWIKHIEGKPATVASGSIVVNEDTTIYAYYIFETAGGSNIWHKPVIYLYPDKVTEVNVKVGYADRLTCTYPKYVTSGWNVIANPNGDLIDTKTNRKLYCLYYEAENNADLDVSKNGFIVEGKNVEKFLEEKLAILGLNEREAEEFIIYWLPQLEANKYNFIRFADLSYINENMPLEINPNPDTIIRVLMEFKGLDEPIEIQEQQLVKAERRGFTVVEWGGTEIK